MRADGLNKLNDIGARLFRPSWRSCKVIVMMSSGYESERLLKYVPISGAATPAASTAAIRRGSAGCVPRPACGAASGRVPEDALEGMRSR